MESHDILSSHFPLEDAGSPVQCMMLTLAPDTWLQACFFCWEQGRKDWRQTPDGLMGVAHGQSQLDIYVRLLFPPFEVWKEWGESSLFQFLLDSSLLSIFRPLVHTILTHPREL